MQWDVKYNGYQKEKLKNDEIISKVVALVEKKEKDIRYRHIKEKRD